MPGVAGPGGTAPHAEMERVRERRTAVGLSLVAIGSALFAGGPHPVVEVARWLAARAGVLLLGLAAVIALVTASRRGARVGPLGLAVIGVVVLAAQRGQVTSVDWWASGGAVLIGMGAFLSLRRRRENPAQDVDPVHTYRVLLLSRPIVITSTDRVPKQIRLCAIGARAQLDLAAAQPGRTDVLELVLTCCAGRVEVTLPEAWAAVAGRVSATRHVTFGGRLDATAPVTDLNDERQIKALAEAAAKRAKIYRVPEGSRSVIVVINVVGVYGEVVLLGR